MRKIDFITDDYNNGRRICDILREFGVSASLLTKLKLYDDGIKVNGVHARAVDTVTAGQIVTISMPTSGTPPTPANIPLNIIYEDDDIIVPDKPPFMPVHESRNHRGDALSNAIAFYCNDLGSFRAVYRLDRDTSGLVLIAKNELAASKLAADINKDYYAVCKGIITGSGTINAPIRRVGSSIIKRETAPNGEKAITHYEALSTKNGNTLVKLRLETGRTHQIRVHMAHIGHPLLGDAMYGEPNGIINRQALHCKTINFTHPVTGRQLTLDSPLPNDIKGLI